ncbi:phage tail protein [Sphingomonas canadensis]|uniref:Phage tail protein n=1 Tax=Sphingomonas canadensis TaxID=1219257 RepID=A0ABW3H606_9SPHN|nr:phage tail protein [Sphingomonas canadensis]MCW3834502.1 phage tail protein [Sphingomonas canadensis]
MATLVLTAVGGLFGPVGAAIGAIAGQAIDRGVLFKPAAREGPRLTELAVQTSSYGTAIPKLFGTMRVAGSVIWATDLIEHRSKEGGGKGQPSTIGYSYTASFAVALSGRAILGVGRIWADGKLLRGAAGDFKTRTGFRLHLGGEDQGADPLIAAAEGIATAPAHRGIAYAVFEDMELGDFGNRIPSLTFEVMADAAPVAAGAIVAAAAAGTVAGADAVIALDGFAASGSARAVAEILAEAAGGWFAADGGALALRAGAAGDAVTLEDEGAHAGGGAMLRGERAIAAADSAPRVLALAYHDPARDYQAGIQRAERPGAGSREARIELPAAITAAAARQVAEAMLARAELDRERRTLSLGPGAMAVPPGARVRIAGEPGVWRVDRSTIEAMVVKLECVRIAPAAVAAEASGGRALPAPDLVAGTTLLHAFELPPLGETPAEVPQLAVAAAGSAAGWRGAALLLSTDGGARWEAAGPAALPAVLGTIAVPPGPAPAALADRANALEVALAHGGMTLADADAAALHAGANLAMAGGELIQFASAEPLGGARWRLSGLWRGRRGTEAAIGTQMAGDGFAMISAEALAVLPLSLSTIGATAMLTAQGPGDSEPASAEAPVTGLSVVPPSPVHLRFGPGTEGTELRWVRRSRAGWRWIDGADSPLGEESERYRVTIAPEGGEARVIETGVPAAAVTDAERESPCLVTVRQIGTHGVSAPASILLPPLGES